MNLTFLSKACNSTEKSRTEILKKQGNSPIQKETQNNNKKNQTLKTKAQESVESRSFTIDK